MGSRLFNSFSFVLIASLVACGPKSGFKSADLSSAIPGDNSEQGGGGGGGGNGGGVDLGPAWDKVEHDNNGVDDNNRAKMQVIIDRKKEVLQLVLPLPDIFLVAIGTTAVKQLPGTTIDEVELDGDKAWALSIPLKYVLKGATLPEKFDSLPNGDSLPFFPSGEVQGLTIQFSQNAKYSIRLYLAVNAVALFVTTPDMDQPLQELFPPEYQSVTRPMRIKKFVNKDKTAQVGYLEVILPKGSYNSGIYMAAKLTHDTAVTLQKILKY